MRQEFEMTQEQFDKLMDACKPVPVMYLSGGQPMFTSPQDRANDAWERLGNELGFDHMTVRPVEGKSNKFFTAELRKA